MTVALTLAIGVPIMLHAGPATHGIVAIAGDTYRGIENQLQVKIPRIEESLVIDGNLDNPVWARALP